eukprot:CAMPEP_0195125788 /NCGR_PEP_ID=MMETSP0448-20130528/133626_1 /TAXON_ID=66468 /ORGANISM="Heterocapsa triquestra, Strain CCMP 448" /LENGTH=45 /DNA_ID= /DNA_START= /DNA_END= /DNA_ORIENTATION=
MEIRDELAGEGECESARASTMCWNIFFASGPAPREAQSALNSSGS